MFFGRNDAKAETPVLWPPHVKSWLIGEDSDAGRELGAGGEGGDRGWDGWMASLTWWMWVWVNSGSWWWTGRPGMLRFMGSQRVRHDWATELNWTDTFSSLSWHREHLRLAESVVAQLKKTVFLIPLCIILGDVSKFWPIGSKKHHVDFQKVSLKRWGGLSFTPSFLCFPYWQSLDWLKQPSWTPRQVLSSVEHQWE